MDGMLFAVIDKCILTFFKIYTVISENFFSAKISDGSMSKIGKIIKGINNGLLKIERYRITIDF